MPTIRDVAKASGVSIATVSYVLNDGPRPVRAETRERVLSNIRRLDYHPNAMARGLARRRMNTLGVLFANVEPAVVTNPYAATLLAGILTAAAEAGFNVTLFTEPWRHTRHAARAFHDRRTDGVLVVAPEMGSPIVQELSRLHLPLVVISLPSDSYGVPSVDVDNIRGAQLATEHLLALGHRRIAHLEGDAGLASASLRREGFLTAMAAAGVQVADDYRVPCGYGQDDKTRAESQEKVRRLLALPCPPTALFAANDTLAFAAITAATEAGLSVPEQLSVVGFDDIPAAPFLTPPLTTIRQPLLQIGQAATRRLAARVEGKPVPPTTQLLEPELIMRGSTAPPAAEPLRTLFFWPAGSGAIRSNRAPFLPKEETP
jgi:DNA-binding LacI/PurR family transcriptional regulator